MAKNLFPLQKEEIFDGPASGGGVLLLTFFRFKHKAREQGGVAG